MDIRKVLLALIGIGGSAFFLYNIFKMMQRPLKKKEKKPPEKKPPTAPTPPAPTPVPPTVPRPKPTPPTPKPKPKPKPIEIAKRLIIKPFKRWDAKNYPLYPGTIYIYNPTKYGVTVDVWSWIAAPGATILMHPVKKLYVGPGSIVPVLLKTRDIKDVWKVRSGKGKLYVDIMYKGTLCKRKEFDITVRGPK